MVTCAICGQEIDGKPVRAVPADLPPQSYQDRDGNTVPTSLHRKCFSDQRRVKVREWALPGQVADREVIEERHFEPPFTTDGPGEDRTLVEWEVDRWREVE